MLVSQFNQVTALGSIFGQWVSILSVTDQEKNLEPQYKGRGIVKVTKFQAHIRKQSYCEVFETSTGKELTPLRESHYADVAHNGFCSMLKKDPERLFFILRFNDKDKKPDYSILIDDSGKIYPFDILKEKSVGARAQLVKEAGVAYKAFKIESIAKMRVGGLDLVDPALAKYDHILELAFEANL